MKKPRLDGLTFSIAKPDHYKSNDKSNFQLPIAVLYSTNNVFGKRQVMKCQGLYKDLVSIIIIIHFDQGNTFLQATS